MMFLKFVPIVLACLSNNGFLCSPKTVTYIRVTGNSNEIPILNSNSSVGHLTQVNEGKSI